MVAAEANRIWRKAVVRISRSWAKRSNSRPRVWVPKLETRNSKLYSTTRGAVAQFGRAPRSQCGGQGFDPPLLHQLVSSIYSHGHRWLFLSDAAVARDLMIKPHGFDSSTFVALGASHVPSSHPNIRLAPLAAQS